MTKNLKQIIIFGFISVLMTVTLVGLRIMVENKRKSIDRNNLAKVYVPMVATFEYLNKHQDTYPDATKWEEELKPYLPQSFNATLEGGKGHRFAMNTALSKRKSTDVPTSAVLFFESTSTSTSANDELYSLPKEGDSVVIGYAAGHRYSHPIAWVEAIKDPTFHKQVLGK
jgi:hypothetical protein